MKNKCLSFSFFLFFFLFTSVPGFMWSGFSCTDSNDSYEYLPFMSLCRVPMRNLSNGCPLVLLLRDSDTKRSSVHLCEWVVPGCDCVNHTCCVLLLLLLLLGVCAAGMASGWRTSPVLFPTTAARRGWLRTLRTGSPALAPPSLVPSASWLSSQAPTSVSQGLRQKWWTVTAESNGFEGWASLLVKIRCRTGGLLLNGWCDLISGTECDSKNEWHRKGGWGVSSFFSWREVAGVFTDRFSCFLPWL